MKRKNNSTQPPLMALYKHLVDQYQKSSSLYERLCIRLSLIEFCTGKNLEDVLVMSLGLSDDKEQRLDEYSEAFLYAHNAERSDVVKVLSLLVSIDTGLSKADKAIYTTLSLSAQADHLSFCTKGSIINDDDNEHSNEMLLGVNLPHQLVDIPTENSFPVYLQNVLYSMNISTS
jgi:hypothetical protein